MSWWIEAVIVAVVLVALLSAAYALRTYSLSLILVALALLIGGGFFTVGSLNLGAAKEEPVADAERDLPDPDLRPKDPVKVEPLFKQTGTWEEVRFPIVAHLPASSSPRWAFCGVYPPGSVRNGRTIDRAVDVEIHASSEGVMDQYYTVVGSAVRFKPRDAASLKAMEWDGSDKPAYVYPLSRVPFRREMLNRDPSNICDIYVQSSGTSANKVFASLNSHGNVKQWWVDLSRAEDATLEPGSNWEHIWIVPIHDPGYSGRLGGEAVPPDGVAKSDKDFVLWTERVAATFLRNPAEVERKVMKEAAKLRRLPFPTSQVPYAGIYWRVEGRGGKPLDDTESFSARKGNLPGPITLGVNMPHGEVLQKPVRMLVGVSFAD